MGMDLTLYPFSCWDTYSRDWNEGKHVHFLGFDRLNFSRQYHIFSQINEEVMGPNKLPAVCKPKPLPTTVRFSNYEDEGLKERKTDPYGSPLTYVTAGELSKVKPRKETGDWNKAILTFISSLPAEMPVLLWWH